MLNNKLTVEQLYDIAVSFRLAVFEAKNNREFDWGDRMNNFPGGCCDDACDLLSYYLYKIYGVITKQGNGVYRDDDPYNTTNHAWLITEDNIFIDITANQFEFGIDLKHGTYVGAENIFYRNLEDKKIISNYDITQCKRLWNDYNSIIHYMSK